MKLKCRLIVCLLSGFFAFAAFGGEAAKESILQFRLVVTNATADAEKAVVSLKRPDGEQRDDEFLVLKKPLLDGRAVQSAVADTNTFNGSPNIFVTLTEDGRAQFAKITREHIGERLAIYVDGKIASAPRIMSEISGGKAQISGSFSKSEAEDLAKKINDAVKK